MAFEMHFTLILIFVCCQCFFLFYACQELNLSEKQFVYSESAKFLSALHQSKTL